MQTKKVQRSKANRAISILIVIVILFGVAPQFTPSAEAQVLSTDIAIQTEEFESQDNAVNELAEISESNALEQYKKYL